MPFSEVEEVQSRTPRTQSTVERWLRRIFIEDWNLKLLALAITFGLWFGVTGQSAPVTIRMRGVQLTFRLPDDMEISNDPREEVEVTLTGSKRALDGINARDLVAYVDVSERKPGERVVQLTPHRVKMELPEGVRLESIEPNAVPLLLEARVERELSVEPRLEGKLPEGYELRSVNVTPQKIRARGPASHIDALQKASTETVWLDGHKENFTAAQTAVDIADPKVDLIDTVVNVSLEIGPQRIEKSFANVAVRAPEGSIASPSSTAVTLYGEREALEQLNAENLSMTLAVDANGSLTPRLNLPQGMEGRVELRSLKPSNFSINK
ncbi:MAG: CdaR family protein [Pyrinomonadaceae bacterium]